MNDPDIGLNVAVDVTNPGQFFACCGLLELAHRLWPGAEGWFAQNGGTFRVRAPGGDVCTITRLVQGLTNAGIEGELTIEERRQLDRLESTKRELKQEGKTLTAADEERRRELGKRSREGALSLGSPFDLRIAWWQEDGDDVPKTFAGRQEVLRMAKAMLSEIDHALHSEAILGYRRLLRSGKSKVEPFCFDALRFAHALDIGFSLDVQEKTIRATAAPVTELLALIGLQRFRPVVRTSKERGIKALVEYATWHVPLGLPPAAGAMSGTVTVPGCRHYRFEIRARDDQKRYGAFDFAIPIGGNR